MVDFSVVILAGGPGSRMQSVHHDKALIVIDEKPLISHVVEAVNSLTDEIIVVISREKAVKEYEAILPKKARLVFDRSSYKDIKTPVLGLLTGCLFSTSEYILCLPCDSPYIEKKVLQTLIEETNSYDAVIPRWESGFIEPLHATYKRITTIIAAEKALNEKKMDMRTLINNLKKVKYIPIEQFKKADPNLKTFININRPEDLKKIK
ncbi:MAG: molybdenum cofactor guanylyltransferase [Candidatus Hodarchaeota archaeon]